MKEKKYSYDRFGSKGQRVGQAVVDILSKDQATQTVEETLEALGPRFVEELEDTIQKNQHRFESPFYVFVLTNKEMWADNVLRNWFIARQTAPEDIDMLCQYPHHAKTLYKVDSKKGSLSVAWTIPGIEDCKSILKNPHIHDPQLVSWITSCFDKSSGGGLLLPT